MVEIIREMLFAVVPSFIAKGVYSLFVKLGAWLDGKIVRRAVKVTIGMIFGLGLYFLIPVGLGLWGL